VAFLYAKSLPAGSRFCPPSRFYCATRPTCLRVSVRTFSPIKYGIVSADDKILGVFVEPDGLQN